MTLMILGLALWWATHLYPIYLPGRRAAVARRLGEKLYKGAFSMFSVSAVAFMVMGYGKVGFVEVWSPPSWTVHLNNLMMLLAIFLIGAKSAKSSAKHFIRHPMLAGVIVWAVAHLLANGDLVLEGVKEVAVNRERHLLTLRGVVRPRDVNSGNMVMSTAIAHMEVQFDGTGIVSDANRPGFFYRLFKVITPF